MEEYDNNNNSSFSEKQKPQQQQPPHQHHHLLHLHLHPLSLSSCFRPCSSSAAASSFSGDDDRPPLVRSPSTWLRSKHHHHLHLLSSSSGAGAGAGGRHRRRHSADFRYDPVSYALNFDDDGGGDHADAADGADPGFRCFSSRLPRSPPPPSKLAAAGNKAKGKEAPL